MRRWARRCEATPVQARTGGATVHSPATRQRATTRGGGSATCTRSRGSRDVSKPSAQQSDPPPANRDAAITIGLCFAFTCVFWGCLLWFILS